MISLRTAARPSVVSGLLAALACGLAAGDVRAVPIPTHITYSTTGPEPLKTSAGNVVFEFQPVTDEVATPGTELKLGTILIHQQEAGTGFTFDGSMFPIRFQVSKVGDTTIPLDEGRIDISNALYGTVRQDGKVDGAFVPFLLVDSSVSFQVGGMSLTLKPVEVSPLWNLGDGTPVVGVDVFASLEGAPVPEPGMLLILAAAAGIGWKRFRSPK